MRTPTPLPRRARAQADGNGAHLLAAGTPRLAAPARRRSTTAIVVAVLTIAGGALAGVVAYKASSGRQSVLAVSHSISAGHMLQASDLSVVDVSTDGGLSLVPASDEDLIVGHPVGVPIAAGAPLTRSDLGSLPAAGPGEAVVGVLCKAGQYPPSLAAGDTVQIVDTGGAGLGSNGAAATGGQAVSPPLDATVIGVDVPTDTATVGTVISLRLSARDAPSVSRAAAAGRVTLILVHPGG